MRVFVAGGTGVIGASVVRQLVAAGHQVTATTRRPERLEGITKLGGAAVILDGMDAIGVGEVVARAQPEVIIHQMTALGGTPDLRRFDRWFASTNELRTRGTDHLLAAARATGVGRFIAQSYTGWTNRRDAAQVVSEDEPLEPNPVPSQRETLRAIEWMERAVVNAPLVGIALRYGSLYGPGASDQLVELVRRRRLPIIGGGGGVWSWIHVEDAASATVAALTRGQRGVYNIVDDDPAPIGEALDHLAHVLGARPPPRIPGWLGRALGGEAIASWMTSGRGASNAKARRELAWTLRWPSWRQGFAAIVGDH